MEYIKCPRNRQAVELKLCGERSQQQHNYYYSVIIKRKSVVEGGSSGSKQLALMKASVVISPDYPQTAPLVTCKLEIGNYVHKFAQNDNNIRVSVGVDLIINLIIDLN